MPDGAVAMTREAGERSPLAVHATVLRYAGASAMADLRAIYTWRTWVFGWLVRVLAQVGFFGLIGTLLGDPDRVAYLVVGNAVAIAMIEAMMTTASTQWERWQGTLPLLIAAPTAFATVFIGRSIQWIVSGTSASVIAFYTTTWLFGIGLPWPRALWVAPLIAVVSVSSYGFGCMLGAVVLRWPEARNLVSNVTYLLMMAIGGVMVPVAFWPGWVGAVAQSFPITHGLGAIRALLDGAGADAIASGVGLTLLAGLGWLAVAIGALVHLSETGRRDGSIEFGS